MDCIVFGKEALERLECEFKDFSNPIGVKVHIGQCKGESADVFEEE